MKESERDPAIEKLSACIDRGITGSNGRSNVVIAQPRNGGMEGFLKEVILSQEAHY